MKYDIEINIATGLTRTQKKWKNEIISWSSFVKRLSQTSKTNETIAQYIKMPKSKQDDIKDVGGFVGGYLVKGSRSNVKYRQLLALDIDFGGMEIWDTWNLLYGNAAVVYSTHKHTTNSPRLRLLIPLDRKVSCEEYQAIARWIANDLDIEAFDDTTYQPQRLMYWPSTSLDGEYVYKFTDGPMLIADEVLATYDDWTDVTTWPVSSRVADAIHKNIKEQQDPLEKDGVIGAFCKAYDIHNAIKNFIDSYEPCGIDNRYTYLEGSTSAGVITYDDKFSYSHHGTDPASSQLCNSFDLVRLHKFKHLDEKMKEDTPASRLPSFKAMEEFAAKDKKVKKILVQQKQDLVDMFDVVIDENYDDSWIEKLDFDKKGEILNSYKNIKLILDNDPAFKNKLGVNELSKTEVILGDLPWRKYSKNEDALNDNDDANIRIYFEDKYNITGKDKIWDAVNSICHEHRYHPIKDYLEHLEWDGTERLDTLFIDFFGCDDTEYTRAVTRKTLLAAVTRIYRPGCHFDTMLTLKGVQGSGKSSFFRKLSKGWFTDSLKDIRNKDALEALQGVWIVEMGELTAMKKSDSETIKSFLSGTIDRFRMAYGRRTKNYPRQCIFVATTNESEFLRDKTGNRRFWIIGSRKSATPQKNVFKITDTEINQIWAEVKVLFDAGVDTLFLDEKLEKDAVAMQESYMVEDPKESIILEYLDRLLPDGWDEMDLYDRQAFYQSDKVGKHERTKVCAAEIWCEALGYSDVNKLDQYQISEINKIIDRKEEWERQGSPMRFLIYGPKRGYRRVNR